MEMTYETQWILIQILVVKDLEIEFIPEMTKDYAFDGPKNTLSRTLHTAFCILPVPLHFIHNSASGTSTLSLDTMIHSASSKPALTSHPASRSACSVQCHFDVAPTLSRASVKGKTIIIMVYCTTHS